METPGDRRLDAGAPAERHKLSQWRSLAGRRTDTRLGIIEARIAGVLGRHAYECFLFRREDEKPMTSF
jgi:hypothetical protein